MSIKHWMGALLLLVSTAVLVSCKDDSYPPISLGYTVEGTSPITNDNTLTLSPFSPGMEFSIQGGNGLYNIESNPDSNIADYRFNGKNALTIIPKALGETSIIIADYAGNRFILRIVVAYPEKTYPIKNVMSHIEGDNLTLKDKGEIERQIRENTPMTEGGRYVFIYTNREMTEGMVKIYTDANAKTPLDGIFYQNKTVIDREGITFRIELTNRNCYTYVLGYGSTDNYPDSSKNLIWKEDVTETYRGMYPALHKAYGIQLVADGIR